MEIIEKIIDFIGKTILFFIIIWLIVNRVFDNLISLLTSYGWGK
jgi:hypothetical protein